MNREPAGKRAAEFSVRRVLVALDAARHDPEGLAAAAEHALRIAASTGAELDALFVEDIGLARLARLPVVRHVNLTSGTLQKPLDGATLRRGLAGEIRRSRDQLTLAGHRHGLTWNVRVVRGSLARAIATAALQADLLIVEGSGYRVARHFELRSATRSAAIATRRSVLLVQRGAATVDALTVLHDPGEGSARALAAALRLSGDRAPPVLLALANTPAEEPARVEEITAWLQDHGFERDRVRIETASPASPATLIAALRRTPGIVVVASDSPWLQHEDATALFDAVPGHVLLVS